MEYKLKKLLCFLFIIFILSVGQLFPENVGLTVSPVSPTSFTENIKNEDKSVIWSQKFAISTFFNKNVGYINMKLKKINKPVNGVFYEADTETESNPFLFFCNRYVTEEVEYLDENLLPVFFDFKLNSVNKKISVQGKLNTETPVGTIGKKIDAEWKSNKKNKSVPVHLRPNTCTFGSIRFLILKNGITEKKKYNLQLLEKDTLKYQKINVITGGKIVVKNKVFYKLYLHYGFFGKFSFIVDKEGNVIEGKAFGIKLVPVK